MILKHVLEPKTRYALGYIVATIDLTRAKSEHFGLTRAARYMAFDVHRDKIVFSALDHYVTGHCVLDMQAVSQKADFRSSLGTRINQRDPNGGRGR